MPIDPRRAVEAARVQLLAYKQFLVRENEKTDQAIAQLDELHKPTLAGKAAPPAEARLGQRIDFWETTRKILAVTEQPLTTRALLEIVFGRAAEKAMSKKEFAKYRANLAYQNSRKRLVSHGKKGWTLPEEEKRAAFRQYHLEDPDSKRLST